MSAFTAARVGQEVVEGHTEAEGGRGRQEVHVVLRRRASLRLDDRELDAPAGTFVLPARARRILDELRAARPDSHGVRIGEALFAVARGDLAAAREQLAAVLAEQPSLRGALAKDPDLAPLSAT
jgi:hypothetical protein